MKALTILQPWAELIATGQKRIENRVWSTSYRGLLAIHAGKSRSRLGDYEPLPERMEFGAIIAVANLVDCLSIDELRDGGAPGLEDHEFAEGPWCWVLDNVRRLDKQIPYRGAQGLFEIPDEIVRPT